MKIYRVSETEWYKANSLEEAIACAMVDTGLSQEELTEGVTPAELTEAELDRLTYVDEDRPPSAVIIPQTFRQQLAIEEAEGKTRAGIFASSEC